MQDVGAGFGWHSAGGADAADSKTDKVFLFLFFERPKQKRNTTE